MTYGRLLSLLLVSLVSTASVGSCSGSIPPDNAIIRATGGVTLTKTSLAFAKAGAANAQSVTASQLGFAGAFTTASTTCTGIATISPSSGTVFAVTPVGSGTCTFAITGGFGKSATLSIGVATASVALTSNALNFTATGATYAQTVAASQTNYTGVFTVLSSACNGIATVSQAGNSITVTPVAAGKCSLTVDGGYGEAAPLNIDVAIAAVALTQSTLSFTATGATNARSTAASQTGYPGSFTASSTTCNGIATISPGSGTSFMVTPVAAGGCTFNITGTGGKSATLTINVTTTSFGGS